MKVRYLVRRVFEIADPCRDDDSMEELLSRHSFAVVMDQGVFVGILTAQDPADSSRRPAADSIHPRPRVDAGRDIEDVLALMRESGDFVLPAFEDGEFIGVVVHEDILDYLVRYHRDLERNVAEHTRELSRVVEELRAETAHRRQTEETLRQSEENFRTLAENAADGISIITWEGIHIYANKRSADIAGYTVEEMLGMRLEDLIHPEYAGLMLDTLKKRFAGEPIPAQHDIMIVRKDGTQVLVEVAGSTTTWGGQPADIVFVRDITARKRAEDALRESEQKYRSLASTADSMYLVDRDCRFLFMNDQYRQRLGVELKDVIGKTYGEIHSEEGAKKFAEKVAEIFETGTSIHHEVKSRRDNKHLLRTLSPVRNEEGDTTAVTVASKDISDLKRAEKEKLKLEAQLHQAWKMEAVGTLAGGIAHDFNNILMGIQGNVSLALMDMDTGRQEPERMKKIERYVQDAAELTRQLLGFARGGKYEVKPTDLNDLIERSSRMFGRTKKEITIHSKYEENIGTVDVDQSQIEQVLLNLYVNAWQAMLGGGDLYIETKKVILDENYVRPYNIEPGNYVKVSVTDTGVGMDEDSQHKMFDPFFTTKDRVRGTGLGLPSAYGIIRNHGGIIDVHSQRGVGTTVTLYLPVSEKEAAQGNSLPAEILKGTEALLLVDDEPMVTEVGSEMLRVLGYEVLVAESGKEAIRIYHENRDTVDMVVLDMIMPEMSGGETYDRLKEINPEVKVLLASGYSMNDQAKDILNRGCNGFIQKPFSCKHLSQKLREVLEGG